MSLEDKLKGWTGPSSASEQDKQERAERMVRQAVDAHDAFDGHNCKVYAKGSYANNTRKLHTNQIRDGTCSSIRRVIRSA